MNAPSPEPARVATGEVSIYVDPPEPFDVLTRAAHELSKAEATLEQAKNCYGPGSNRPCSGSVAFCQYNRDTWAAMVRALKAARFALGNMERYALPALERSGLVTSLPGSADSLRAALSGDPERF